MLTDCGCAAVSDGMCGWDASGNLIGEAGAVALAKALESGQCQLKSLNLFSESMCHLPHVLLGCAPFVPAGMVFVGRWCVCARACRVEGVGGAFGMLTDCGCAAAFDGMCGWDASGNRIGDAGAVALAKALESGQCQLESLYLGGESMCLCRMCCWAVRLSFRLAWSLSVGGVCARARAEWR
eukprot:COSAG02_NODE_13224_length_1423_cov_4.558157_1_plen_181_part_10